MTHYRLFRRRHILGTGTTYRGIGSLAYRPATWTHRVARLDPQRTTWTLVVTGPTVRMWGFFTPSGWVECWRADRLLNIACAPRRRLLQPRRPRCLGENRSPDC